MYAMQYIYKNKMKKYFFIDIFSVFKFEYILRKWIFKNEFFLYFNTIHLYKLNSIIVIVVLFFSFVFGIKLEFLLLLLYFI